MWSDSDSCNIVSGYVVFRWYDTHGIPMDMIGDILRERGMGVSVPEFILAAHGSGNFSAHKIRGLLRDMTTEENWKITGPLIDQYLDLLE